MATSERNKLALLPSYTLDTVAKHDKSVWCIGAQKHPL